MDKRQIKALKRFLNLLIRILCCVFPQLKSNPKTVQVLTLFLDEIFDIITDALITEGEDVGAALVGQGEDAQASVRHK